METKFFFEQLQIPAFGEGALFSGEAILAQDGNDTDSFIVEEILIGDNWLQPFVTGSTFSQHLFKAIADVLYDDKSTMGVQAALEWADFVSGETPAVPMFKRRAGLINTIVRGATLQAAE